MEAPVQAKRIYRFGTFEADPSSGELLRRGSRVRLQDQPFRLLIILLEQAGTVVPREQLRQRLWPADTYVEFDGSLKNTLKKLRAALGDDAESPTFIETIPKRGYRLIAPVSVDMTRSEPSFGIAPTPESLIESEVAPTVVLPVPGQRSLRLFYMSSALLSLIVIGAAWFGLHRRGASARAAASFSQGRTTSVALRKSIAVLGFRNLSGRVDDAWLATAFGEMLSTDLAGGGKLRLVSGEDVANLRLSSPWSPADTLDRQTTARIGTALNSDLLVLGSYTTIGKSDRRQLRLDVRLQDAKTGEILSGIAEIGDRKDLFHLVSQIGGKLRDRLGVPRLEDSDESSVFASLPSNPEADRLYSLGLVKMREYDYFDARGLFEEAVKADPKFPLAYSMLSRADIALGHDDEAKAQAKRGLDLAGGLSRVQRMEIEASYYHALANRSKAAEIYRILFDLYPDSLDYGLQLVKLQLESYHPDAALETIRQLRRLPAPARDDPGLDLQEGRILFPKDAVAADHLYHSAAKKALEQGKKLIYAKAQQMVCFVNNQHVQNPAECRYAYEIFLAAGNRTEAGSCLQLMAESNRITNHNQEAASLYGQAISMLKQAGDRERVGVALNNLSLLLENEGQWIRAERAFREAELDFQAVNDKANAAGATANLADILVLRGHLSEAAELYRQGWEIADSTGRMRDESLHTGHGALLLMQGNLAQAKFEIEAQVSSLRSYGGDPWQLANSLTIRGDIEKAEGNSEAARKSYEEALDTLKKVNASVTDTQVSLAELAIAEGHPDAAEPLVRQAITAFEKDQSVGEEIGGYTTLSRALLAQGKVAETQGTIKHAFGLADLHEFPVLAFPLQILEARADSAAARPGAARRASLAAADREIRSVFRQSHRLGLYNIECEARLAQGELEMKLNSGVGRAQLSALAAKTRSQGLKLIARQAEQAMTSSDRAVAANIPAR